MEFFNIRKDNTHIIATILGLKLKFRKKINLQNIETKLDTLIFLGKINALLKDDILLINHRDNAIKFYLPNVFQDYIQKQILDTMNFFEVDLLQNISKYIEPNSVIVDAGANIGNHTIYFSKICKAKEVISFEPQRELFGILNKNIEINQLNNVKAYNYALTNKETNLSIKTTFHNVLGGTSFQHDNSAGGGEFKGITLDSLGLEAIDFLKIDVEGHQLELLEGAKETITKFKPIIWIEMLQYNEHFNHVDNEHEFVKPQKLLKEYGYELKYTLTEHDFIYVHSQKSMEK